MSQTLFMVDTDDLTYIFMVIETKNYLYYRKMQLWRVRFIAKRTRLASSSNHITQPLNKWDGKKYYGLFFHN